MSSTPSFVMQIFHSKTCINRVLPLAMVANSYNYCSSWADESNCDQSEDFLLTITISQPCNSLIIHLGVFSYSHLLFVVLSSIKRVVIHPLPYTLSMIAFPNGIRINILSWRWIITWDLQLLSLDDEWEHGESCISFDIVNLYRKE